MVEDEESGRLNELVRLLVLDDAEIEAEPDAKAQPKPGAITPLGVRVDKGGGMLSTMGASNTLAEMDGVLSGLRHWNARRERELAISTWHNGWAAMAAARRSRALTKPGQALVPLVSVSEHSCRGRGRASSRPPSLPPIPMTPAPHTLQQQGLPHKHFHTPDTANH
ncbi:hypothetical protein V8C86DRAFT_1376207 [Haematococcus lacustris]